MCSCDVEFQIAKMIEVVVGRDGVNIESTIEIEISSRSYYPCPLRFLFVSFVLKN
jgi:hypothetical protein